MTLHVTLFLTYVATAFAAPAKAESNAQDTPAEKTKGEKNLQSQEDRIQTVRKDIETAISKMEDLETRLVALAKDDQQLDQLASEIEGHVKPTLSDDQRKALESDYEKQLDNVKTQNVSAADAEQLVAGFQAGAEKDLKTLRDADRKDSRNLLKESSKARRDAHTEVREMAKASRKTLQNMSGATSLEMLMEKAGKTESFYDHAEGTLEHEKEGYRDRIDSLHDHMDDLLEETYSKVHDRIEAKADALEEDASSRRAQRHQAVMDAAQSLKLSGSLSRVEKKLHRLEKAMSQSKQALQEELHPSPALIRTNTICSMLIAVGLAVSLAMHAMQRRAGSRFGTISQPVLPTYQIPLTSR